MFGYQDLSLTRKIPGQMVLATLLSVLTLGLASYFLSSSALRDAAQDKFTALVQSRHDELVSYLGSVRDDAVAFADNSKVSDALAAYQQGWGELAGAEDVTAALQKRYIDDNPNPIGEKHKLDAAGDGSAYSGSHARFHPMFRQFLEARGYYDIFLISTSGDVVYTVFKERDFASNVEHGAGKDTGLGEVFRKARAGSAGSVAFSDFASYAPSNGVPASFIATPIVRAGKVLGVLAFQMPIDRINHVMQAAAGMGASGETFLVGADHLMRSDSRFAKESSILKTKVETDTVQAALSGASGFDEVPDSRGVSVLSAYRPLDFEGVRWAVVSQAASAEVMAPVRALRNVLALIGVAILAVRAGIGVFVSRGITGPIAGLTGAMGRLADGEHGVDIPGGGRGDELGQMAAAVLVFKENMIRARELAEQEAASQAQREARAQTIERLTAEFERETGLVMNTVASAATEMQATASSMSAAAEQTSAQSTVVAAASEQASANVQTVASAAEELSASIGEISRQVSHSAQIAGKAVTEAERTNIQVQGLTEAAQKIGEVVQMITGIAGQTNLLALNATIEAARAGDAGKGFAVVASEVKNLANETAKATEQITDQIAAVQQATREAVAAIQSIGGTIGEISDISTMIASAMREQGAATQEIARNVAQASVGTHEVSTNIVGVSHAAVSTGASAEQVLGVASELSQQSELLRGKVVHFLSGIKAA